MLSATMARTRPSALSPGMTTTSPARTDSSAQAGMGSTTLPVVSPALATTWPRVGSKTIDSVRPRKAVWVASRRAKAMPLSGSSTCAARFRSFAIARMSARIVLR